MIVTLIFIIAVMTMIGRWLYLNDLTAKSWAVEGIQNMPRAEIRLAKPKLGLVIFITVITGLFSLLISAYSMRMGYGDWARLPEPPILWLNTGVIILSSVAFQWAQISARRDNMKNAKFGLILAGIFAIAFLAGQLLAWRQMEALGYFAASNPANAFFYLITALHGLHLAGGLVAWAKTGRKLRRGTAADDIRMSLDMCTVYWHFLLLVWLALFGLLLAT